MKDPDTETPTSQRLTLLKALEANDESLTGSVLKQVVSSGSVEPEFYSRLRTSLFETLHMRVQRHRRGWSMGMRFVWGGGWALAGLGVGLFFGGLSVESHGYGGDTSAEVLRGGDRMENMRAYEQIAEDVARFLDKGDFQQARDRILVARPRLNDGWLQARLTLLLVTTELEAGDVERAKMILEEDELAAEVMRLQAVMKGRR